jgi:hypothetical protein
MDFIMRFPRTQSGYDSIWVIVDQLTKVAHFIPVKTTDTGPQLTELYISRIVCLHRVPKKIVSDRGTQFTLKFWEMLRETLVYPMKDLNVSEDLSYQEYPVKILVTSKRVTRNKSPHRRRSYLGERRRIEGRIPEFLF